MENEMQPEAEQPIDQPETSQPEQARKFSPVVRVTLTEEQEKKVIDLIDQEMKVIAQEYADEDYYGKIERTDADYEGAKDENAPASDKKLLLTTMMADIVASKAKRQTFGATPLILLEKKEEADDQGIRDREDRLDFILRTDCDLEKVNYVADRKACVNGVAVLKTPYDKQTDVITRKTLYRSKDISKFESLYANDLLNSGSLAYQNWTALQTGGDVEVVDVEDVTTFEGVKPYRVDLRKFFARLSVKDFRRHKVIGELIDDCRWSDIDAKSESEYYDQDKVTKLREKVGDRYKTESFKLYEAIIFTKLQSELGDKPLQDKYQRYVVTYEESTKIVLRCIHFPYEHGKVYYIPRCAIPRDDSWMGYSFSERLVDVKAAAEGLINSLMDAFTRSASPIILTDDTSAEWERKTVKNDDGSISVIKFPAGKNTTQMKFDAPDMQRVQFLNWLNNFAALVTGVDPMINSGAQTPDDPRAPLGKAQLKQVNSNMRIEDIITNLQDADAELAEQVEGIYRQYIDINSENGMVEYFNKDKKTVPLDIYSKKVRYVCHGSRISFDKAADMSVIMAATDYVAKYYPEVFADVSVKHALLEAFTNAATGTVEKKKAIILNPLKMQVESREEINKLVKQMSAQGKSQEEIQMTIAAMTGQQPQMPQGQPIPQGAV